MWFLRLPALALGGTLGVPQPYDTIQGAIDMAKPGDVIEIDASRGPLAPETVTVSTPELTVIGVSGRPVLTAEDSDDDALLIDMANGVVLSNLEIVGGGDRSGIRIRSSDVTVDDVVFTDTHRNGDGGAIWVEEGTGASKLTVVASRFEGSSATENGGAIASFDGDTDLRDTTFVGGSAGLGGGGHIYLGQAGSLTVSGGTFTGGTSLVGGSIGVQDSTSVEVIGAYLADNSAADGGGGIQATGVGAVVVRDSVFEGNQAGGVAIGGGGGMSQIGGDATYSGNTWCGNTSGYDGGGLEIWTGGNFSCEREVFVDNHTGNDGGAMWLSAAGQVVHVSALLNSATTGDGHGVAVGKVPFSSTTNDIDVFDSYFGDHPSGSWALWAGSNVTASTKNNAFWNNAGGDWHDRVDDDLDNLLDKAQLPIPSTPGCDRELLRPAADSLLVGAAADGTTIGALEPCGEATAEIAADGLDADCDGFELCYLDADGDGFGTPQTVLSTDLDCAEEGVAANDLESCPGFDDAIDTDEDGVPDGCSDAGITAIAGVGGPRGSCGCGGHPPPPLLWVLAIAAGIRRRRQAQR